MGLTPQPHSAWPGRYVDFGVDPSFSSLNLKKQLHFLPQKNNVDSESWIGGHEGAGKVVKLGPGSETSTIKVGDRVGVKWVSGTCGNCRK